MLANTDIFPNSILFAQCIKFCSIFDLSRFNIYFTYYIVSNFNYLLYFDIINNYRNIMLPET